MHEAVGTGKTVRMVVAHALDFALHVIAAVFCHGHVFMLPNSRHYTATAFVIRSFPRIHGRSAGGIATLPSACW